MEHTPPATHQLPTSLEVDENDYPDDAILEQIATANSIGVGGRWLVNVFPELAASIGGYGKCSVEDDVDVIGKPIKRITFHTQGWSGCEDFIEAVLRNTMLRVMFYESWRRGGQFTFCVPQADLDAHP